MHRIRGLQARLGALDTAIGFKMKRALNPTLIFLQVAKMRSIPIEQLLQQAMHHPVGICAAQTLPSGVATPKTTPFPPMGLSCRLIRIGSTKPASLCHHTGARQGNQLDGPNRLIEYIRLPWVGWELQALDRQHHLQVSSSLGHWSK